MSALQAIPTQHGIEILNSELKNTVTKYRLIGALTHNAPKPSLETFYQSTIETSYYDDNGVLTFVLNLPVEQHFDEYLHQIHVLDSNHQAVIECSTPKVALPKGIGGMVTIKVAVSGEAGQVIFKHLEYISEREFTAATDKINTRITNLITGFSEGQKWRLISRDLNVTYTNSRHYPIQIIASVLHDPQRLPGAGFLFVDGVKISWHNSTTSNKNESNEIFTAIIPPGSTYKVQVPNKKWRLSAWAELY
ncbi:hypothetical protein [Vibrio neptunius]|uniref:hypothetical protein n=1 Tax=Vibrio neptunius TaxID=170651 RepID=UPI003CE5635F